MGEAESLTAISQQEKFVRWWTENVRGKGQKRNVSDPRYYVEDAEKLTKFSKQQVSKWRKRLAKRPEYAAALYGVAYRPAPSGGPFATPPRDPASVTREWLQRPVGCAVQAIGGALQGPSVPTQRVST